MSALQLALRAVLVSPHFLFLQNKTDHDPVSTSDPVPINDFDLASRLSYFLWSSMPDEQLFRVAAQGSLRRRENLRLQVKRMLRDRKARALGRKLRQPVAADAQAQGVHARPGLVPRLRRIAERGDAHGDGALLRVDPRQGPQRAGVSRRGLHVRQRTPGAILRHRRRHWRLVSPGLAGRHAARRRVDAGERSGGDVQPESNLARQARQMDPGEHPGCAAVAPAVGRGSTEGRQRARRHARHTPAADGTAPDRPGLCLVPPPHGPAGLRTGKLRRHRRLAHHRRRATD